MSFRQFPGFAQYYSKIVARQRLFRSKPASLFQMPDRFFYASFFRKHYSQTIMRLVRIAFEHDGDLQFMLGFRPSVHAIVEFSESEMWLTVFRR